MAKKKNTKFAAFSILVPLDSRPDFFDMEYASEEIVERIVNSYEVVQYFADKYKYIKKHIDYVLRTESEEVVYCKKMLNNPLIPLTTLESNHFKDKIIELESSVRHTKKLLDYLNDQNLFSDYSDKTKLKIKKINSNDATKI